MFRVLINLWILTSIAAAPNGRDKRHFSYIRDFIMATFFGDNENETPSISNSVTESEYKLYRIPGFDDILIETVKCKPEEFTIVSKSGNEENINPFESYIGTKNMEETGTAFGNVNKLLSTGILEEPQINRLQKTIVPIMNSLHFESEEIINPIPITRETVESVVIKEGEIKEIPKRNINFKNGVPILNRSAFLEPTQKLTPNEVKGNKNNINSEARIKQNHSQDQFNKEQSVRRFIDTTYPEEAVTPNVFVRPNQSRHMKQRINKVVYLGSDPFRFFPEKNDNGYATTPAEYFRNTMPKRRVSLKPLFLPLTHFDASVPSNVASTESLKKIILDESGAPKLTSKYMNMTEVSKIEHKSNFSNSTTNKSNNSGNNVNEDEEETATIDSAEYTSNPELQTQKAENDLDEVFLQDDIIPVDNSYGHYDDKYNNSSTTVKEYRDRYFDNDREFTKRRGDINYE